MVKAVPEKSLLSEPQRPGGVEMLQRSLGFLFIKEGGEREVAGGKKSKGKAKGKGKGK